MDQITKIGLKLILKVFEALTLMQILLFIYLVLISMIMRSTRNIFLFKGRSRKTRPPWSCWNAWF